MDTKKWQKKERKDRVGEEEEEEEEEKKCVNRPICDK